MCIEKCSEWSVSVGGYAVSYSYISSRIYFIRNDIVYTVGMLWYVLDWH